MERQERILKKIETTIRRERMICAGDGVVVGFSGGPDSTCLLHALCRIKEQLGISRITAVHINHGLRGAESDGDEAYAEAAARAWGAEFRSFHYDVAAAAAEAGEGTEAVGRRLRYEAFELVRQETGATRIAVAHNRNDQAETVLMRILRGTGLRGLGGISYVRGGGRLIRPVLDLSRREIEEYCAACGLETRTDRTNLQPIYTRNKIRLQLLPLLQREYNPNAADALVRLSAQAQEDEDCLRASAEHFLTASTDSFAERDEHRTVGRSRGVSSVSDLQEKAGFARAIATADGTVKMGFGRWNPKENSLRLEGFGALHPAIAKRVLLLCAAKVGMEQNMSALHLNALLALARSGEAAKTVELAEGFFVRRSYGKLWFLKKSTAAADTVNFPFAELQKSGTAELRFGAWTAKLEVHTLTENAEKRSIRTDEPAVGLPEHVQHCVSAKTKVTAESEQRKKLKNSGMLYLDYDLLLEKNPAVFRFRRPGDRIRPLHMQGTKKLQDYFTDRKIPKHLRDTMPLLVWENRVLAAGTEAADDCALRSTTRRVLTVELQSIRGN